MFHSSNMLYVSFLIVFVFLASSCAVKTSGGGNAESVKRNAELALEACGKGNVWKVSIDGFKCKDK